MCVWAIRAVNCRWNLTADFKLAVIEFFGVTIFLMIFFYKFLMKINFQLLMVILFLVLNLNECYQNHEKKLSVGPRMEKK